MKSVKGTKTEQNLLKSFAGESQARGRYVYFASIAKKEGYEQIAAIFNETAEQEKEHAKRFFKFLEGGMVEITEKTKNGANSIPNLPKWPMKKDFLKLPKLSAASQQSKPDMKPATSNSTNV